jgi:hypothetical protein
MRVAKLPGLLYKRVTSCIGMHSRGSAARSHSVSGCASPQISVSETSRFDDISWQHYFGLLTSDVGPAVKAFKHRYVRL